VLHREGFRSAVRVNEARTERLCRLVGLTASFGVARRPRFAKTLLMEMRSPENLIDRVDWRAAQDALDDRGRVIVPALLSASECEDLRALYDEDRLFRSRVVMARHNFGRGEYRYFDYPLPPLVATLRSALYRPLASIANRWQERLGLETKYPPALDDFLDRCHAAGQNRPTPLLLRYGAGDYNCLHQDLYGEHVFPLQAAILLSAPGRDFEGGEFVLTEQRPRRQTRVDVVPIGQGDAVIFAVNSRPVAGSRGDYRAAMRHGVSALRSGNRITLGIIFHDAL